MADEIQIENTASVEELIALASERQRVEGLRFLGLNNPGPEVLQIFVAVNEAITKAQEAGEFQKDRIGQEGHQKYGYMTLDAIMAVVRPAVTAAGGFILSTPVKIDGQDGELTRVVHAKTMQSIESFEPYRSAKDRLVGAKAHGASRTYALRYNVRGLFALGAGEDTEDDIAEPQRHYEEPPQPRQAPPREDEHGERYIHANARRSIHLRAAQQARSLLGPDAEGKSELGKRIAGECLKALGFVDEKDQPQTSLVTESALVRLNKLIDEWQFPEGEGPEPKPAAAESGDTPSPPSEEPPPPDGPEDVPPAGSDTPETKGAVGNEEIGF